MGEMTDDDVAFSGERFHRPDIRTKVGGQPFFGQARLCPVIPGETPFEVTAADEEQPSSATAPAPVHLLAKTTIPTCIDRA